MDNCIICSKHQSKENIIFEGTHTIVSLGSIDSHVLGYVYIEPKKHVEYWEELADDEFLEISRLLKEISYFLKNKLNAERVYTVTISEAVRHLHIHVIPRDSSSDTKGLILIEQATQQKVMNDNYLPKASIEEFKNDLSNFLLEVKVKNFDK